MHIVMSAHSLTGELINDADDVILTPVTGSVFPQQPQSTG